MNQIRWNRGVHVLLIVLAVVAVVPQAQCAAAVPTPREFAPGIISTGHEFTVTFTPGGNEACFSRSAQGSPVHIFCSQLVHGAWQPAEPISFSSNDWSDLDPFITPDGKRLFFISTRPHDANPEPGKKDMDIWVADREGTTWGTPRLLENVNSEAKEGSPSASSAGTLYFFSDRSRAPNSNSLFEARLDNGQYTAPTLLQSLVDSSASDSSPFVTPDGTLLLFYSDRQGGFGKGDLYAAVRLKGIWRVPVNLGPVVNTGDAEYNPELSPDGRQLFFGRNRRIYTVSVSAVPALQKLLRDKHSSASESGANARR